jgi:hypothetical protein
MKSLATAWVLLAALIAVGWSDTQSVTPTSKYEKTKAAAKIIHDVLRRETEETIADRAELLKPALELSPNNDAAKWQSGFVFDTRLKQWFRYDEVTENAKSDKRVATYRDMRPKYVETVANQMELARWCLKRNLADQARAHLTKVLELNQDNQEARLLLGQRLVAGQWLSDNDIANAQAEAKKETDAFNKWKSKLEKIHTNLERGKRQNDAARSELMAITNLEAAGAIALILCADGGDTAPVGIEALKNLRGRESAMALTQLAFYLPWDPLGKSAANALNAHNKYDFVPLLLSQMQTPIQSKAEIYGSFDNGTLLYRHIFYREGQDEHNLAVFDTPYRHVLSGVKEIVPDTIKRPLTGVERESYKQQAQIKNTEERMAAMAQFQADAAQKATQREQAVKQFNLTADNLNFRLCHILSEANQQSFSNDDLTLANNYATASNSNNQPYTPSDWYQWWNDYNEVYTPGIPTRTIYAPNPGTTLVSVPYALIRQSCLVGDTLVWTEMGPVPIKDMAEGDRVFACDVETGCLALKPVLKRTIRPKEKTGELVTIATDGKKIVASGGHVFWVAGKGWIKARDLKAGMYLHTLKGTVCIDSVGKCEAQQTYNLIVADFHSFFAGEEQALTHDNTIRQPTNMIVPGLPKQADLSQNK